MIDPAGFERLVREALDSVPSEFQERMINLEVVIEPQASDELMSEMGLAPPHVLLGLYRGVPLTERGIYEPPLPDRILIFRDPILTICHTDEEIRQQVRRTVLHEIAHFFGITDHRLHELDAY